MASGDVTLGKRMLTKITNNNLNKSKSCVVELFYCHRLLFEKKANFAWSELNADEETEILKAIDDHWEELNLLIDQVFAGKKIKIKRIK